LTTFSCRRLSHAETNSYGANRFGRDYFQGKDENRRWIAKLDNRWSNRSSTHQFALASFLSSESMYIYRILDVNEQFD
jgi:hypothetical protein